MPITLEFRLLLSISDIFFDKQIRERFMLYVVYHMQRFFCFFLSFLYLCLTGGILISIASLLHRRILWKQMNADQMMLLRLLHTHHVHQLLQ